ncbi:BglG family transcription antiterminator LicT [Candidatus Enterococcus clewellii]|uniref:Beta-glucoside operon transcriptional antiterminator n=1 Tax=Candidatus Enterococcus clewellii TaxID=1834193 RepID=A0A242K1C5_9ENTE|nr:PRD domain-containing protein [Enterococcus sp. 9E7_DIV0242]OTP11461.1 bglG2 [Enterococcus sp. 9E7_DIV0242]
MISIKKVLNSSVVLVENNGKEMIALGKGIGFGKKIGDQIPDEQVDKIFLEVEEQKSVQIVELVGEIPFEFFEVTRDIIAEAEKQLGKKLNSNLYLTLTDHLHFAVERAQEGLTVANRLYWEIKSYYPQEFQVGKHALELLNEKYAIELPQEEASNIAFHLINAQSEDTENADGFKYAKMIGGIVNMVRYSIQKEIDTNSIHYTRFITHVRFFVERYYSDGLLEDTEDQLYKQMWTLYPSAMETATKVKEYLEKVYQATIPDEEIVYLGVHINRLMKHST